MLRKLLGGLSTGALLLTASASQAEPELMLGDKAPSLEMVNWIKGEPVTEFKSGHIYVLDFWATWCGPCIQTIPHVNDLHNEYRDKDVHVIGVAIWPRPGMTATDKFVAEKGDEMAYRIAEDVDAETGKAWEAYYEDFLASNKEEGMGEQQLGQLKMQAARSFDGVAAKKFMEASGNNGIPTVMVVNRSGRIAWMGHPTNLDEPLEQIVAGTYDIEKAIEEAERIAEAGEKLEKLMTSARELWQNEQWEELVSTFDQMIALDHPETRNIPLQKYMILVDKINDDRRASAYGHALVKDTFSDNAGMLNALAWGIATEFSEDKQDLELALMAAERADELTDNENPSVIDTLARVHFEMGNVDKAISLQEKAISLAEDDEFIENLRQSLEEYRRAKKEG